MTGTGETVAEAEEAAEEVAEGAADPTGAGEVPPELVEAVTENPEAVARLLDRLDLVNGLLDAATVATAGLDDDMVTSLAERGSHLGMAAGNAATPAVADLGESVGENADDLAGALETLARLEREGTLDTLAGLADVVALAEGALDDDMVTDMAATGATLGGVAATAGDEEVAAGLENVLRAVGEAETAGHERVGTFGLLRAMRDPEVKAGMGYLVALARAIGREDHQEA